MNMMTASLTLITLSGAFGLALSSGHATFRPDVEWTTLDAAHTMTVGLPTATAAIREPERQNEAVTRSFAQRAQPTVPDASKDMTGIVSDPIVAAPTVSPRPKARSTLFALNVADAPDLAPDVPADPMWIATGIVAGAANHPTRVDGFDPSSVSMATVMSKGPVMGSPVPNYLHGVYR